MALYDQIRNLINIILQFHIILGRKLSCKDLGNKHQHIMNSNSNSYYCMNCLIQRNCVVIFNKLRKMKLS